MASTMMAKTFLGASLAKAVPTNGKVLSWDYIDQLGRYFVVFDNSHVSTWYLAALGMHISAADLRWDVSIICFPCRVLFNLCRGHTAE